VDGASHDVGRRAADVLLARIQDPHREAELHLLTPTLQARGTSAPPSG
jgi:DNA-binding LacI/PurR family transcriptional regulator